LSAGSERIVNLFLTTHLQSPAVLVRRAAVFGVRRTWFGRLLYDRSSLWSNGMSGREGQAEANLLLAFAMMIGGALGVALPMALVIIWVCS